MRKIFIILTLLISYNYYSYGQKTSLGFGTGFTIHQDNYTANYTYGISTDVFLIQNITNRISIRPNISLSKTFNNIDKEYTSYDKRNITTTSLFVDYNFKKAHKYKTLKYSLYSGINYSYIDGNSYIERNNNYIKINKELFYQSISSGLTITKKLNNYLSILSDTRITYTLDKKSNNLKDEVQNIEISNTNFLNSYYTGLSIIYTFNKIKCYYY